MAAHLLSGKLGYESNGHSNIYNYSLMLAGIFYMLAGMFILWNILTKYFPGKRVWFALVALFGGTNLFYYTVFQPGMSHVYSFFLFSLLIFLTDQLTWHFKLSKSVATKYWILTGVTCGLLVLIRPTNIIALLYPLYFFFKTCQHPVQFLQSHLKKILLSVCLFFLVFAPQLYYWYYISGKWILWSYGDEGFVFWKEPKLLRVLFDPWNGWILYSPIVIFPLIELFLNRHLNKHGTRIILYILILATYVFASWWAWWFGGAFGHRSYVEFYTFLAIPFCLFLQRADQLRLIWKVPVYLLLVLFVYYSMGLTLLYTPPWDGTSWTYESLWIEIKKIFFL